MPEGFKATEIIFQRIKMDTYKVDYHIHSHYSDGKLSPGEIAGRYHDMDYDIIALTDHDGIDGLKEFFAACEAVKIKGVPGIELSTYHEFEGKTYKLHLLGYGFDCENRRLNEVCDDLKEKRKRRNEKLIEELNLMGIEISPEEVLKHSKEGYIGKPNIARVLINKGYAGDMAEAFGEKLLGSERIRNIKKEKLSAVEAIDLITEAGGMPVLAHPGKIKNMPPREGDEFFAEFEKLARDLRLKGLKGIECIYPDHSSDEEFRFINISSKLHLHITEGSDYHGE